MNGIFICHEILKELQTLLQSGLFLTAYRIGTHFTRNRKLSFTNLFYFLLQLSKKSLPIRISDFIDDFPQLGIHQLSKQALSKARKGIHIQAFVELVRISCSKYYAFQRHLKTWHGYLVLAVDGTTLQMPQTDLNLREFGISTNQSGTAFAMASASLLFDVLNDIILDAQINICNYSERAFAFEHFASMNQIGPSHKRILLFDRGYASYDLCGFLLQQNLLFVIRLKKSSCVMRNTKEEDMMVEYGPKYPKGHTVCLRALRISLPGEDEILLTNLFSPQITVSMFRELYFLRWGVESKYMELKDRFQIENFSGSSPHVIRQDFYLSIFYSNLVSILKADVDSQIQGDPTNPQKGGSYQCNRGYLISRIQRHWVKILAGYEEACLILEQIIAAAKKVRSQIRRNRKYERKVRHNKRKHHHNRKPCL